MIRKHSKFIILFEPFSGASGDMILGSLIDMGANFEKIKYFLEEKLNIKIYKKELLKNGIKSTKIDVIDLSKKDFITYKDLIKFIKNLNISNIIKYHILNVFNIIGLSESKIHNQNLEDLHFHEVGQNDALVDIIGTFLALEDI